MFFNDIQHHCRQLPLFNKINKMKKILLLPFFLGGITLLNAQVGTKPTKTLIQPKITNLPENKRTDLTIIINQIEDNSIPRQNQFTVHYTITNIGTEDINRYVGNGKSFYLKGYFSGPTIETASFWGNANGTTDNFQMISFEDTHTGSATLKPGESSKGTIKVCKFNPAYYDYSIYLNPANYKFVLQVDSKNEIAESNENNNTAEYSLPPHVNNPGDLFLSSVTLSIQTGNDNKEANNSDVDFYLAPASLATLSTNKGFRLNGYKSEIKINATTSISLNKTQTTVEPQNSLEFFKQTGLKLMIVYNNRVFPTDAWKINNVSAKLDFKDRFGNDLRTIHINFPISNGILGYRLGDPLTIKDQKRWLILEADGNFNVKGNPVITLLP